MTDADFGVQLERLVKETQELRGAIELSNYRLEQIERKLEGDGSLTARLTSLEKAVAEAAKAPPPPPPPKAATAPAARKNSSLTARSSQRRVSTTKRAVPFET